MINVIVAGVGGQGTQMASRMLCVASSIRNWGALSFDEFGLAEMGAATTSHVRIANRSEDIHTPKVTVGTADLILSFEPLEAVRNLSYLSRNGRIVTSGMTIQPPGASLADKNYSPIEILQNLREALNAATIRDIKDNKMKASQRAQLFVTNDLRIPEELRGNQALLPTRLIAEAIRTGCLPFTEDDLLQAIGMCVRPSYRDANIAMMTAILR